MLVRRETLAWLGRVPCVSDVLSVLVHAFCRCVGAESHERAGQQNRAPRHGPHRLWPSPTLLSDTHTHTTTTITFHELLDIFHFIIAPLSVSLPLQVSQHQKPKNPVAPTKSKEPPNADADEQYFAAYFDLYSSLPCRQNLSIIPCLQLTSSGILRSSALAILPVP